MAWRDLVVEWRARRAGRRHSSSTISHAVRDIVGPSGFVHTKSCDELAAHGDAYVRSFDRRLPPSIFISERDRLRSSLPMPLVERCIEDWGKAPPIGSVSQAECQDGQSEG